MPQETKTDKSVFKGSTAAELNGTELPSTFLSAHSRPSHEKIALLAFEYCQQRADGAGDQMEDWLRAERALNEAALSC